MGIARAVSLKSKDKSTKIGAVAVDTGNGIVSTGYNDLPRRIRHTDERHDRPLKYKCTSHAEENLVAQASRKGVSLMGCRIYITSLPPCPTCARLIIQSGITEVIVDGLDVPDRWQEDCGIAKEMLEEADIKIRKINEDHPQK